MDKVDHESKLAKASPSMDKVEKLRESSGVCPKAKSCASSSLNSPGGLSRCSVGGVIVKDELDVRPVASIL